MPNFNFSFNLRLGLGLSAFSLCALAGCGHRAAPTPRSLGSSSGGLGGQGSAQLGFKPSPAVESDGRRELAAFFPGAQLSRKALALSPAQAARLSRAAGVKFSGEEKSWQLFEAARGGQIVGHAIETRSALPASSLSPASSRGELRLLLAVDRSFKISRATVTRAPDAASIRGFVAQAVGKGRGAKFKVGADMKLAPGLPPQVGQLAADDLRKGLAILEESFKAAPAQAAPAQLRR